MFNKFNLQNIRRSDLGDVVMLDADNNTVETPFHDLESLPSDVVNDMFDDLILKPRQQKFFCISCLNLGT